MLSIQRIIFLINLALITMGAYFGVSLFYQVITHQMHPPEISQIATQSQASQRKASRHSVDYYRPIMQRDLFKTQKSPATALPKFDFNLDSMEETKLKLKLWGTVTGTSEQAYAVIEDTQKRQQNLYRIGDSIQNATLKLIQRSKVVLSLNGRDEVLTMEEIRQSGKSRSTSSRASNRLSGRKPKRTQRVSLRRNMIDDAMNDVSSLMTQIRIKPHFDNGQPNGLALSNIKANSIFRRMGLRNGDILKSVDGQEIRSVDDALRLYESLKNTNSVSVELQRRGSDRTINYNIR